MPYIDAKRRSNIKHPKNPGELNYLFTQIIKDYIKEVGESYRSYNDCIGALQCCGLELYRRKIAPYEDKKIEANGDVY